MAEKCKECGCVCAQCSQVDKINGDMHLHVEIENLRQRLLERDNHIVTMETHFLNEADKFPNGELASIKEEILSWQEKYSRLYDAHKRVQKVNQNLEDKLLRIVDKCETEKGAFTKDIATLSHRLADANYTIHRLTQDNEKYRNDVNLAIQLLQCKPSNFVSQRYDSLPSEMQAKVRTYVAQKRRPSETPAPDVKSITVPISTFPPTAMVYNITKTNTEKDSDDESDETKPPVDIVSAAIMAKVLEERERERIFAKHCDTCTCHRSILSNETGTQTIARVDVYTCNKCGSENEENDLNFNENTGNAGTDFQSKKNCIKYEGSMAKNLGCVENNIRHPSSQSSNEISVGNCKVNSQSNSNSIKHASFQLVNEKLGTKNFQNSDRSIKPDNYSNVSGKSYLNIKNSIRQQCLINVNTNINGRSSNYQTNNHQAPNDNSNSDCHQDCDTLIKTATFQNSSEKSAGKMNVDKARQIRSSKRPETQITNKPKPCDWSRVEKNASHDNLIELKTSEIPQDQKGQSQMDVINERLWKNEWSKAKTKLNSLDVAPKTQFRKTGDSQIDVINDRVWRNDGSPKENSKPTPLTLIEVQTADPSTNQSDCRQTEDAASPSFSSDSLVISSSDPPSSSSDPMQLANQKQSNYNNNLKSTWQDRTMGPRGCSMRLTPGSKNILLDNAGHYQTILYTSSNSRPNTALVHAAKSSRSGRSTSTSSEENSPILPPDNGQLQRVAEWIQASGTTESPVTQKQPSAKSTDNSAANRLQNIKSIEEISGKVQNSASIGNKDIKLDSGTAKIDGSISNNVQEECIALGKSNSKSTSIGLTEKKVSMDGRDTHMTNKIDNVEGVESNDNSEADKDKDLITFELPQDERVASHVQDLNELHSIVEPNSEIRVTREMEETYLKLAASLDPVTLSLSSSGSARLTIEKYRKEHRRLQNQKTQDKAGWTT